MVPLLSTVPGIDRVLAEGTPLPPGFDCQAPLMSLPFHFGTTLANMPAATPYLGADAALVERWRAELNPSAAVKIGIAWQGNPKHRFDQHRSFPIHWFRSIAAIEGVQLYSLQKGHGSEKLAEAGFPIVDLGSRLDETGTAFQETAAVMCSLDLVITCDSALAHLAGALGTSTWLALSQPADWRWLQERDDSPGIRACGLFRQAKLGDWRPRLRPDAPGTPINVCESNAGHSARSRAGRVARQAHHPGNQERAASPIRQAAQRAGRAGPRRSHPPPNIRAVAGLPELLAELKSVNTAPCGTSKTASAPARKPKTSATSSWPWPARSIKPTIAAPPSKSGSTNCSARPSAKRRTITAIDPCTIWLPTSTSCRTFDNANTVAIDLAHNVFLVGALLARKPDNLLELGVGSGYVTHSLLHGMRFNRKRQADQRR